MKYCQKCGKALLDDAAFCPACGSAVEDPMPVRTAVPVENTAPVTMETYEQVVSCSLVCVIVSAIVLLAGVAIWWFANVWIGVILCLAAELVAVIPNTKVQDLFKKANRHITDKKQCAAEEKALRKELKKKNGTYRAAGIVACVCLAALVVLLLTQFLFPWVIGGKGRYKILAEVKEKYGISKGAEVRIAKMFDEFDQTFAQLGKHPSDKDFYEYADAVYEEVNQCLDEIDEKYNIYLVEDELDQLSRALSKGIFEYSTGSGSGERCAEAAINLVEGYADFFYGVEWFTAEQLDSLD